jgi:hypothetical protein
VTKNRGLPEDTEVSYCWFCGKYHSANDYWCPRKLIGWILANSFDWYIKAAAIIMIIVFTLLMLAMLFDIPIPHSESKPSPPLTPEQIKTIRDF